MPDVATSFPILTDLSRRDDIVIPQGDFVKPTMGSIRERPKKDGTISYTAQIILKRKGHETYREAETFARRSAAVAWLKHREAELKQPGGIERAKVKGMTVGDAIDHYINESVKEVGRTKAQVLRSIKKFDLADIDAADVQSEDIVTFARELTATGVKPQTVMNYLSHLSAVFAIARPAWGIPLDQQAMKDAFAVAKRLGMTAKSDKRGRRPTLAELDLLMGHFTEMWARGNASLPMTRIIPFALFSTRRQGEIVRLDWADYDSAYGRILVRDMKHPGQKIGNDVWCDVPAEAVWFMGERQKKGLIFPFTEDAISASFTRACKLLEIEDLHFHDLRHEGVSRLFEMGNSIPHVAAVSGHRSWQSLQRYTHLKQTGDKYETWKWLSRRSHP